MPIKPRALIIGCKPPPVGGIAQVAGDCVAALSAGGRFEPVVVDIARRGAVGKLSPANLIRHFNQLRLLKRELKNGAAVAHLHASVNTQLTVMKNLQFARTIRSTGTPLLFHPHSGTIEQDVEQPDTAWRQAMDQLVSLADGVAVMSPYWLELFSREWPEAKLHLLVNGVDTDVYSPGSRPESDVVRFLFMGHHTPYKGLGELGDAWARLVAEMPGRVALDMLGEARDAAGRELTDRLGGLDGVDFHGVALGERKLKLLRAAEVFVLPSHHENLPVALLEAMSCGMMPVASAVGAVPEVLRDGAGVAVPPRDAGALYAALKAAANDAAMRRAMGEKARDRVVADYNHRQFSDSLHRIYSQIARG